MSAKHTPGPWYACGDEVLIDMGDRAHLIATAADWSEETEPNARLIAAAPDLLYALEHLEDVYLDGLRNAPEDRVYPPEAFSEAWALARAASASATGVNP